MRNLFKFIVSKEEEKIKFITLLVIFLFSTVIAFAVQNENIPFELNIGQSNVPQKLTSVDVWDGSFAMWSQGSGSATDPYLIESAANLYALSLMVNQGNTYSGKYFQLTTDIYLANRDWPAIGDGYNFSGRFDGSGCSITGVKGPLFGTILNANIKNLSLTISIMSPADMVGGIVKVAKNSSISKCFVYGQININSQITKYCGGIVAMAENTTIYHCGNSANITFIDNSNISDVISCAGIVANASATNVHSCYNKGSLSIKCSKYSYHGNLFCKGIGGTKCIMCFNTGNVSATVGAKNYLGGTGYYAIASGIGGGSNEYCYNTGTIKASDINEQYNYSIAGLGVYSIAGGIATTNGVSSHEPLCKCCYNVGSVSANFKGKIGADNMADESSYDGTNCYAISAKYSDAFFKSPRMCALLNTDSIVFHDDIGINSGYPIFVYQLPTYTITWLNEDGSLIDQTEVAYDQVPTHATPTKSATAEYTYTFAGWTPTIAKVTANATYTATFTQTLRKYTITWKNADGTTLKTKQVDYGTTPSYTGSTPTKESSAQYDYTFAGWTPEVAIVTQAATYTATYTSSLREYLVTFLNEDNTVISSKNYKYGETPVAPADPIKQNTAEYTYTFNGWDNAIVQVQGPQTYKATYTATKNSYTITWQNEDGSLIDQTTVEYGQIPAHADPTKPATAEYTYSFAGWTPTVVSVTGDATYKATFSAIKNKYLITFRNDDGTELKSEEVEYGVMPIAPADPTKESTAQYDYTFAGWTPAVAIVTQAATYTATYTSALREYLVTFLNDDNTVISSKNYKYGKTPIAPADPIKQNTAEYTYTFNGWDNAIVQVQGPQTYKATYTATKNSYTITWQNEDGSLIDQTTVEYGQIPAHADPVKQNTAEYTYTFAGWTPAVVAVTGDATYKATFTATKNSYTITWQNEDGSLIDQTTVEYGVVPTHAEPTKETTEEYTYTFAGWTPAVVAVTGDATYKATFTATKNSYTITWQDENGSLIDQTTVEYGQIPAHADPVKQNTAEYTYTFAGWTPAVVAVTSDATYKATFTATKNSYTITWQNEDGSLIDQTTVEYGQIPAHAEPTKEATEEYTYAFAGWDPAIVAVTGDATYKATFSSEVNVYTISVSAVNGQVIGGGEYQYGATIDLTAIPNEGYVFDQWSDGVKENPRTITVTGDAEYTALFTSTEGFENIYTSEPVQKVIIDQKVYILRGEKVYTLQGQEVK